MNIHWLYILRRLSVSMFEVRDSPFATGHGTTIGYGRVRRYLSHSERTHQMVVHHMHRKEGAHVPHGPQLLWVRFSS